MCDVTTLTTELPSLARSTSSEITRRTTSRKSLDGRRKTQPVDQDSLSKAIEDLNNDKATDEPLRNSGENGFDEAFAPVSPPRQSQASFCLHRIPL